jgi:hypothetical protein
VDLASKPGAKGNVATPTTNGTVQNWTTDAPSPAATPGVFTVVIHGSPGADHGVTAGDGTGTEVKVPAIVGAIKGAPGYVDGMPVRMVSCFAGAGKVGGDGKISALPLAQQVANGLKADVQASPYRITESRQNGQIQVQERSPQGMRDVHWQTYSPGRTPEIRNIIPFGY